MTKTFEEKAQILADVADRNGMWCQDVAKFPELLKGTGIKPEEATDGLVGHAEGINRELFHGLVKKYETKPEGQLTVEAQGVKLFNVPVESVIRWMGANNWEREDVTKVMSHLQLKPGDKTIAEEIKRGQANHDVPALSDDEEEQLWNVLELVI